VNGQEPNDIDCLTLDKEKSAQKIEQSVYKFGIHKGPKRGGGDAGVIYAFEWKRPGMKDEVIDVVFHEFEHSTPPGVDTDVDNILMNKHGLTRKVLGPGLVPIETALRHIEQKSFVYYCEPNPDKKTELLRLQKFFERGWTCKTQIPLEVRNKLAEGLDKSGLPNELRGCAEFNKEWWKVEATKLSIGKALVAKPEVDTTISEAASSDPGGGMKEQRPMKHNDMQLQEMLRLARSCLKYEALPGEPSMRVFFDKFDAELTAKEAKSSAEQSAEVGTDKQLNQPEVQESTTTPPLGAKETIDSMLKNIASIQKVLNNSSFQQIVEQSGKDVDNLSSLCQLSDDIPADRRTCKNQTAQLEQIAKEANKALEAASAELSQEVMKTLERQKDEMALEVELKRAQHQLRLAKDMVKRQNGEIENLHSNIHGLKVAATSSTQSAPAAVGGPYPPPSGSGRSKAGRTRPTPGVQMVSQGNVTSGEPGFSSNMGEASLSAAEMSGAVDVCGNTLDPRQTSQMRPPPNLAHSIVLPPKNRNYESVLTRPRDSAWKMFIP
jgi:hypothetical protein